MILLCKKHKYWTSYRHLSYTYWHNDARIIHCTKMSGNMH